MDILYISPETTKKLAEYCEDNLIFEVLDDFKKKGQIIDKNDGDRPSKSWIITNYIIDNTIDSRKKLSVILSFSAIGGFIQIGDRIEFGDVNTLCMLRETNNISDEDFDFFVETFNNFSHGNGVRFS